MVEIIRRQSAAVFEERAAEYDRWFENSLLYEVELAALRDIR